MFLNQISPESISSVTVREDPSNDAMTCLFLTVNNQNQRHNSVLRSSETSSENPPDPEVERSLFHAHKYDLICSV